MGGGEILKKGWLIKSPPLDGSGIKFSNDMLGGVHLTHKEVLRMTWRRRWFCLRSSKVLEYYKSEDRELKGVVNLEDCKAVNSDLSHKKYKFVFDVETKDRTYYLVARTREEMMDWVEAMCKACGFTTESQLVLSTPPPHQQSHSHHVITSPQGSQMNTRIPLNERFRPTENGSTTESLYSLAQSASHEVQRQLSRDLEVPAGTPLAEALASKGLGSGQRSTSVSSRTSGASIGDTASSRSSDCISGEMSYFTPRPADRPGFLVTVDPNSTYSHLPPMGRNGPFMSPPVPKPRSHTLMPGDTSNNSPPGGGGGGLGSRSFSNSSSYTDTGAEVLSNGYMKPRPLLDRVPHYDYPPLGTPRPANVGDTSPKQQHRSALLKQKATSPPSIPNREDTPPDDPHTYINMETLLGVLPPPIDRSTKPPQPVPPRINRDLKPSRASYEDEWAFQSESSPSHSDSISEDVIVGSYSDEGVFGFGEADIPRLTSHSMHYTQIEFDPATRRPIPLPRTPNKPAGRRVNYADVDLDATRALAESHKPVREVMSLGEAEQEALAEKHYVNLDKMGSIDDETNPGYYIHMRNFTFDEADKPTYYTQHQYGHSQESPDGESELYQAPRET